MVLLGVLIFQFLERVPDRRAAGLVKYHLGWKLAFNLKLGDEGFHPTTLVHFRQRLLRGGKGELALRAVLEALEKEGFVATFPATAGLDAYPGSSRPAERLGVCA